MDKNTAVPGAQEQGDEVSPFEGFQSEEYNQGTLVDAPAEDGGVDVAADADEASDAETSDAAASLPEEDDSAEEDDSESAPRKKTFQERINELTRARREAERRAEALDARLRELETETALQDPAPQTESAQTAPSQERPDPDDYEFGELDSRYIAAVVRHETDLRINAYRQQLAAEAAERANAAEREEMQRRFREHVERGSKKYVDYYEKVVVGAEHSTWPLSAEMGQLIVQSDVGDEVAYHLASHPAEAERLYRSSPVEQARFFGQLEARFTAADSAAGTAKKGSTAKAPKAPPPVTPARGASGRFQAGADSDDFSSFERAAMEQSK